MKKNCRYLMARAEPEVPPPEKKKLAKIPKADSLGSSLLRPIMGLG
jgi:hypothetical protein